MVRYTGIDFSADWKVTTYEGKTILAPWKFLKDNNGNVKAVVRDEDAKIRPLEGFSNFRHVQQAVALFGGVGVRK